MEQRWLPVTASARGLAWDETEMPSLVSQAGDAARFAFEEFFHGQIRNTHTRKAYLHVLCVFSDWCQGGGIELVKVTPGHVGRYLDALDVAVPTRKVHLAALRAFFDELVMRHVIILNPALSVCSERYQAVEGKTPEIAIEHARRLLKGLEVTHSVGLRDRAIVGILIYTAVRVVCRQAPAVGLLRRGRSALPFHEKGGKVREIPVRHDLLEFLNTYLEMSGLRYSEPSSPLFRTTVRRTKRLTQNRMTADDMARMVKRRLCG